MKLLKSFLSFFCTITTAITIVVSLNYLIADAELSRYILLHILVAALVTALVTAVVYSLNYRTKAQAAVGVIIHYAVLCVIMILLGVWFDWMEPDVSGISSMCLSVAMVYVITFAVSYIQMRKDADDINKALRERNGEE